MCCFSGNAALKVTALTTMLSSTPLVLSHLQGNSAQREEGRVTAGCPSPQFWCGRVHAVAEVKIWGGLSILGVEKFILLESNSKLSITF